MKNTTDSYWLRAILLACSFVVATSLELAPSTSTVGPEDGPHPEEIALLDEVAAWSGEDPSIDPAHPFPEDESLTDSVQARSASFVAFVSKPAEPWSERVLVNLPHGRVIGRAAQRHGVDPLLLVSMIEAESSFIVDARSGRGAIGLMQVMPETAGDYGVDETRVAELSDPALNVDLGARYIGRLITLYDGDLALALAAYNAGPGNVKRYNGVPPFRETTRYVEKVLRSYLERRQDAWRSVQLLDGPQAAGDVM